MNPKDCDSDNKITKNQIRFAFQSFQYGEILSYLEEEKPRKQQAESSDVWL